MALRDLNLLSIDPAKNKPTVIARFRGGRFLGFSTINHSKIIRKTELASILPAGDGVAIIESPYINSLHSAKNQLSLCLSVGEIGQWVRDNSAYNVEYVSAWGGDGWIIRFFGAKKKREAIFEMARQICKADGVKVKSDDESMSYCLGLWYLSNNSEQE